MFEINTNKSKVSQKIRIFLHTNLARDIVGPISPPCTTYSYHILKKKYKCFLVPERQVVYFNIIKSYLHNGVSEEIVSDMQPQVYVSSVVP